MTLSGGAMMRHMSIVLLLVLLQAIFTNSFFAADRCHDYCGLNSGKCLSNGRCLCMFGWTGPNAAYITSGPREGMIVADFCTKLCRYNFLFRNPACVSPSTTITPPTTHPTFSNQVTSCEKSCGKFEFAGHCLNNDKCLCWWGWTGNNATYVNNGPYKNRIVADDCMISCHYTHDFRNPDCIKDDQDETTPAEEDMNPDYTQPSVTSSPSSITISTSDIATVNATSDAGTLTVTSEFPPSPSTPGDNLTQGPQAVCDPKCERLGQGECLSDGSCLCWWGWTGPNATYITTGNLTNRIKADYCTEPCHYTHDYMNTSCATIPTPQTCDIPSNSTPQLPCLPQCGAGVFHGECLRNGRCLCWWGWTGPHSCFIDGGDYNNRIIADYCEEPCHYTHDYRNNSCVQSADIPLASQGPSTSLFSTSSDVTSPAAVQSISMTEQPTSTGDYTTTVDFSTSQHLGTTNEYITLEELSTTEQPIATEQPTTAEEQPITAAKQPIATEQPTTAEEQPVTAAKQPIATAKQPITTEEQPITTEEQPTPEEQPITTEEQISITREHPTAQPTTTGEQPESTEQTPPTEPHDVTESTEPVNVVEPSGTESTEATELLGTTVPTERRELIGFMEPTETTQPTEETDEILLTTQTEPPEPEETNRPTEFAEYTEARELTKATEPSERKGALKPTEEETTDWQEWLAATETTDKTVLIDPTLATEPDEFTELTEPAEIEITEPTEAVEPTGIKSTKQAESVERTDATEPLEPAETEMTEPTEAVEPTGIKSTKQAESVERTDATEPLESAGPIQPNKPMELNHAPEETNQIAEGPPSSKEQFPAVSSKKHSPTASLSTYMVAVGILAIIFAMIGLVAMVKHHGKCFKRHLGYHQLGDNAHFVNEREMSDELSKVI